MIWSRFQTTVMSRCSLRMLLTRGVCALSVVVWLVLGFPLVSCTTESGYLRYQPLKVVGWEYRDSVTFEIDSLSTSGKRDFSIALRKSSSHAYPYTSLTMAVHQTWHLGDSTLVNRTDTLECAFGSPDGTLRAKGVSLYPYEFPLCSLPLPAHATGRIVIRHLMNQQMLPGFDAIGLRME